MPRMNFVEQSRSFGWGRDNVTTLDNDDLKLGCLIRIAAAVEKIATNYEQLINERNFHKQKSEDRLAAIIKRDHQIAGLRGALKRAKRS